MTRQRVLKCSSDNCPHEQQKYLSDWIREKLPDSANGFMVSDIDFVLFNYKTKKIIFIECKTHNKQIPAWQRGLFILLNKWLKRGVEDDYTNLGFHLVTFEKTSFNDGKVFFDKKEVSETELVNILSFK